VASARLESRLTLLKLNSLQPFRFGFCRAAYPFQSSRESSVSFDICRVARNRFLVTLDGVRDLILTKKHAAGVGYKSGTLPVDGRARKFGCLPALRCGFCSSPMQQKIPFGQGSRLITLTAAWYPASEADMAHSSTLTMYFRVTGMP
jgi:hypothetical protein